MIATIEDPHRNNVGRCRFGQTWAPGTVFNGQHLARPYDLVLWSETNGQPVCTRTMAGLPEFQDLLNFCEKTFEALQGAPRQVLVPCPRLADELRRRYPDSQIGHQPDPLKMSLLMRPFYSEDHIPYSMLARLGERKALRAYQRGVQFLQSEVWKAACDREVLSYTVGQQQFGLIVTGKSRWQDMGFSLYSGLKAAHQMKRPVAAFGPGNPLLVHYTDLNFLDQHQLALPREKYPMFALFGGNADLFKEMSWLLERLPEFISSRKTLKEGKRRLEMTRLRVDADRVGLEPWESVELMHS